MMVQKYFELFKQEMIMLIKSRIRYKVGLFSDLILIVGTFILAYYFKNNTSLNNYYNVDDSQSNYLFYLGFVFWQFGTLALGFSTNMITNYSSDGLLELHTQGFASMPLLYFFKLLVNILTDFLIIIGISLFMFVMIDFNLRELIYLFYAIIGNIPNIVGMYGIGLIISAITLREKRISQFILILQVLLMFLTNVFSPMHNVVMNVIPFASGIEFLRNCYVGNGFDMSELIIYLFVNLFWVMIGTFIFKKALLRERKYGSFNTY